MQHIWKIGQGELHLRQGDITLAETDAIVNAANASLAGGGGVDGAIHRAAGPKLLEACANIIKERGKLLPGQAVITPGFNLSTGNVIHTVGPIWRGGNENEQIVLALAYARSLDVAKTNGLSTVAFPAISCGVYGYPVEQAAAVALNTLREGVNRGIVKKAIMYIFSPQDFSIWSAVAEQLLGESDPIQ